MGQPSKSPNFGPLASHLNDNPNASGDPTDFIAPLDLDEGVATPPGEAPVNDSEAEMESSETTPSDEDPSSSPVHRRSVAFQRPVKAASSTRTRATSGPPSWTQPITYRERLGGYLHPRDMRRLVTPFSGSNEPEFIIRRHVLLLNFDPLRAIVLRDRLLVLVPDGADQILETLAKRIKGGLRGMEASVFGDEHHSSSLDAGRYYKTASAIAEEIASQAADIAARNEDHLHRMGALTLHSPPVVKFLPTDSAKCNPSDRPATISSFKKHASGESESEGETTAVDDAFDNDEWDDLKGKGWIDLPFELQSVDAVLHTVSGMLTEEANDLQEYAYGEIDQLLHSTRSVTSEHGHDILRYLKGDISEMVGRCQGFVRAINVLLDDDEDLALMNLSRLITHPERFIQPVPDEILHEESDEPELILEAYLQQSNSNTNVLELLRQQVTTTEELMTMKSDAVRNRLLYINTVVSLLTLAVGTGAFIGSIFGMNLYSGLEDNPTAFVNVIVGSCVGILCLVCVFGYFFFRAGAIPEL
jgi:magnesium transporter